MPCEITTSDMTRLWNKRGHIIVSTTLLSAIGEYVYIVYSRYKRADITVLNIFILVSLYHIYNNDK